MRLAPLARAAWVALVVLAIGGGAHLWHHFADPDCETTARGPAHPCSACAALHGGLLAGPSEPALTPPPGVSAHLTLPPTATRAAHVAPVGPPRGPPTA
jgi:hypothetical protein